MAIASIWCYSSIFSVLSIKTIQVVSSCLDQYGEEEKSFEELIKIEMNDFGHLGSIMTHQINANIRTCCKYTRKPKC